MRGLLGLAVAAATGLVSQSLARPLIATPGGVSSVVITEDNTVNGTASATDAVLGSNPLNFALTNNIGGDQLYAYVTGRDVNNQVVLLTTSGEFYYPDPAGRSVPVPVPDDAGHAISLGALGEVTNFAIPDYLASGRVWVSAGPLSFFSLVAGDGAISLVEPSFSNPSDPSAGLNWGFIELTNNEGGIYTNISFVDFIGLVMSMRLTLGSGEIQTVQGLEPTALEQICQGLKDQAAVDGQPWDKMCVTRDDGTPLRILAPNQYIATNPGTMDTYYAEYIDQVWDKYSNEDLIIDTQGEWGQVPCRAAGDQMTCQGDSIAFPKPTIVDVWGCNSGPFANEGDLLHQRLVARMCAAFYRTELLLDGGNVTPSLGSESYYTVSPTSHYGRLIHQYEVDQKGYAFSFDDVNVSNENQAGVLAGADPQLLEIFVGGGMAV